MPNYKNKSIRVNDEDDSVLHEFNGEGQKSMGYWRVHSHFEDVSYALIIEF
jgi:hypothetical protein